MKRRAKCALGTKWARTGAEPWQSCRRVPPPMLSATFIPSTFAPQGSRAWATHPWVVPSPHPKAGSTFTQCAALPPRWKREDSPSHCRQVSKVLTRLSASVPACTLCVLKIRQANCIAVRGGGKCVQTAMYGKVSETSRFVSHFVLQCAAFQWNWENCVENDFFLLPCTGSTHIKRVAQSRNRADGKEYTC